MDFLKIITDSIFRRYYFFLWCLITITTSLNAQPIPVEFAANSQYSAVNLVLSKNFTHTSRFGFFHLSTLTKDYNEKQKDDLALQNLIFFEAVRNFRFTGGMFYGTKPGFTPTAGMQYVNIGKKWFVLVAPRINIEKEPAYNVFSIIRYKTAITDKSSLYLSLQALNLFNSSHHIKSYQWVRFGLEKKGTQYGLAANFDEFGPKPKTDFNLGLFVRKEIF